MNLRAKLISSGAPLLVALAMAIAVIPAATSSAYGEPLQVPRPKQADYRIAIHCSLNLLQLWGHGELVREYPIETGKGGLGKKTSGDHKTPIGDYEISWIASKISKKGQRVIEHMSWCKGNKFVHAPTGPSLEKLWAEPYGGNEATIMSINYPNEKEMELGYSGDCIHIHADKRLVGGQLKKSYGCIHMFPEDAKELYEMVQVGVPVKILP
jgi:hypothetical protein